jgi:hypothetical protein
MLIKFFYSFKDLENSKKLYETSNLSNLALRDAKTLEPTKMYPQKEVARAMNELHIPHF